MMVLDGCSVGSGSFSHLPPANATGLGMVLLALHGEPSLPSLCGRCCRAGHGTACLARRELLGHGCGIKRPGGVGACLQQNLPALCNSCLCPPTCRSGPPSRLGPGCHLVGAGRLLHYSPDWPRAALLAHGRRRLCWEASGRQQRRQRRPRQREWHWRRARRLMQRCAVCFRQRLICNSLSLLSTCLAFVE